MKVLKQAFFGTGHVPRAPPGGDEPSQVVISNDGSITWRRVRISKWTGCRGTERSKSRHGARPLKQVPFGARHVARASSGREKLSRIFVTKDGAITWRRERNSKCSGCRGTVRDAGPGRAGPLKSQTAFPLYMKIKPRFAHAMLRMAFAGGLRRPAR